MKLSELTVKGFVEELASNSPAPGGGSVAALVASLGAALTSMVASLTVGKQKYSDNWETMETVRTKGNELHTRLLELMEADTEAFNAFMAALKLPKMSDEEKALRSEAMQKATRGTIDVPFKTLRCCAELVDLAVTAADKGNPNAITDAGTAAVLARAAAVSASYNVRINLMGLKDETFVAQAKDEIATLLADIETRTAAVEETIDIALVD